MAAEWQVKQCKDCGEFKSITEFWRRKQSPDGLSLYCRECFGKRNATTYRKRQAAAGKSTREYRRYSAVPDGMKYCPSCKEIKATSEFGRNRAEKSGLTAYCRPCHNRVMAEQKIKKHGSTRSYHLKRRYGLTEEEVAELQDRQAGLCLICLHRRPLHVDHDHDTGTFRGLLCFRCNGGLGQFKDDPRVIRRAVDYLEGRIVEPYCPPRRPRRRSGTAKSGRHYRLIKRYGIGEDEVRALIDRQGESCPICARAQAAAVDHDHVTGAIRGILCADCNTGMGQLRDDAWVLRRAIEYLTGGLWGLRRVEDGGYEVVEVRPRGSAGIDPGWDLVRACTDDLAFLGALAHPDSGDPWETDVRSVGHESGESRFAVQSPVTTDEPVPDEPVGVPEDLCFLG